MKLLLLADPGSIHTVRWAHALSEKGIQVFIFGLADYRSNAYAGCDVKIYSDKISPYGLINKLRYLTSIGRLRRLIREIKPDLVHAHYASSYGLLARLSGFRPFVISVWGSDVYEFPKKSVFHRLLLKFNLKPAFMILSTSIVMAEETRQYLPQQKQVEITPFGIDLNLFRPLKHKESPVEIIIGTVKSLYTLYGIDTLIKSFSLLKTKKPELSLKLIIAGGGTEKDKFTSLVNSLKLEESVIFLGQLQHSDVPAILNGFDIYVALSNHESFGVAVIEASACELPVVVSDAPGLKEVVKNGKTGLIVPKQNPELAAAAIEQLVTNPTLRQEMGRAGRRHVMQLYDWRANTDQMIKLYRKVLRSNQSE